MGLLCTYYYSFPTCTDQYIFRINLAEGYNAQKRCNVFLLNQTVCIRGFFCLHLSMRSFFGEDTMLRRGFGVSGDLSLLQRWLLLHRDHSCCKILMTRQLVTSVKLHELSPTILTCNQFWLFIYSKHTNILFLLVHYSKIAVNPSETPSSAPKTKPMWTNWAANKSSASCT